MSPVPMWVLPREGRDGGVQGTVTFRAPGRGLLQQAAQDGESRVREEAVKSQEEDASSKPPGGGGGGTTSVTREAEGRALACLPCKMALPPAAAEPGEKGSSKGTRVVHKLSRDQCGHQIQFGEEMYGEEMDGWLLRTQSENFKLTYSDFYWSGSIFISIYNSIYIIYIYNM